MPTWRRRELARTPPPAQRNGACSSPLGVLGRRNGSVDKPGGLFAIHCDPAADFPERVTALNLPTRLSVVEDGFVWPEFVGDGTSCLIKRRPELIAGGMRDEFNDADGHDVLSGFGRKGH